MRLSVVAACLSLCLIGFATANDAHASIRKDTNIPAEGLGPALNALARDRNFQIVYVTEEIANVRTAGATGTFTTEEALKRLLIGTGLSYRYLDDKTVTILPVGSVSTPNERAAPTARTSQGGDVPDAKEGKARSSNEFRLAQVDQGKTSADVSVAKQTNSSTQSTGLTEIVVTAQKRSERLQDVPVPVTALDADTLSRRGEDRLQDYFATVPGLSLNSATFGGGTQTLSIRGLTTSAVTNPTVGISIDDVPFGSSSVLAFGSSLYPDFDPSDLSRIEVLRGPQSTLYGASSLGGLIKFVTEDPSTQEITGRLQVLGNAVQHGGEGYALRGAINLPLSDEFAVRASGFVRRDPGYVENVSTGQREINQVDVSGGRISGLWRPNDTISLKVSAMLQDTQGKGTPAVDTDQNLQPVLGDLKQERQKGTEAYSTRSQLYTATLTATLAPFEFTSISGYGTNTFVNVNDFSLFGPFWAEANDFETKKYSQEFRLTSPDGGRVQWLLGAFYTHESSPVDQRIVTLDPSTGGYNGLVESFNYFSALSEYAVFGDLTVHITDPFDIQFGGRESWDRQKYNESDVFGAPPAVDTPTELHNASEFTYLVTPRYKLSQDVMLYARFASGYRVGGPNVTAALQGVPFTYQPDKTNNYELGIKGAWLDRRLNFDASIYYINWKNIQIYLLNGFNSWITNGGDAKSQGIELSLQSRPVQGLNITATATYNDAQLTQNLPPASSAEGISGDRLPFSSKYSGSLALDQDFPIVGQWSGFAGGSAIYVGAREGQFPSAGQVRLQFPGYVSFDLRSGVHYASWTGSLLLTNIADRRGIVGGNTSFSGSGYDAVYIQPRTLSLSLSKSF